ncbi:Uncharacterised protein [Enterobacter hormaechei]|jgi:hypothetical protein|nr:Uncharacterised protein [Enterobacter hormaechei]VAE62215.1 Uncharacterised protein [Enterobacter hormaechei]
MFSALRQQKIAHVVLIAAKMGDGSVSHRRTGGDYFFAWRVITVR